MAEAVCDLRERAMTDELKYARRILKLLAYRSDEGPGGIYCYTGSVSGIADTIDKQAANILREYGDALLATIPQVKDTVDHSENCYVTKQPWTP